jgi:hypothetical protein
VENLAPPQRPVLRLTLPALLLLLQRLLHPLLNK